MKNCFNHPSPRKARALTGISAEDIKKRVAEKLGDAPAPIERTCNMKSKFLLSSLLAASLLFTVAFAASYSGLLRRFFTGDTSALESAVSNAVVSERLGSYQVTVHEALSDDRFGYLTVSFEALDDEAQAVLDNADQLSGLVQFTIDCPENQLSYGFRELQERHTANTDWYSADLSGFYNPERKPLLLRIAGQEGQLEIPTDSPLETFTVEPRQTVVCCDMADGLERLTSLDEISHTITVRRVDVSPFGVSLHYVPENPGAQPLAHGFLFFAMQDGSIRSETYFARPGTISRSCNKTDGGSLTFQFRELDDFNRIRAVVLGDTAYPLDGGAPAAVSDGRLPHPFLLSGVYREEFRNTPSSPWWIPIRSLCEQLGAEFAWNSSKECGTIQYCGETIVLTPGTNSISIPGQSDPITVAVEFSDGEWIADLRLREALRIEIGNVNMDVSDSQLLVIP